MAGQNFLLVAAIDFGTTYSGYAFSFRATSTEKDLPEKIRTNKSWGAELGFQSYKSPTSVLVTNTGKFLAFGYKAEQMYGDAIEEEEEGDSGKSRDMLLFRHFKMMLHNKENLSSKSLIASVDGTIMPALDIFAHAIRYLKDHMLDAIKLEIGSKPDSNLIRWVITVPAIWGDQSKQFMREATFRAGCIPSQDSRHLVIALEPEAASLCCRRLGVAQYDETGSLHFAKGTKYMVLDCGGGTIDITVHIIESDNRVKELHSASGGPWGGTEIDKNFIALMERAMGKEFIQAFQRKHPQSWLEFLMKFETAKKHVRNDGQSKITMDVSFSMFELFQAMNKGKGLDKHFKAGGAHLKGVTFSSGKIIIDHKTSIGLFSPVTKAVIEHTRKLLEDYNARGLKYIFMVGGFSECRVLQHEIKRNFERNGVRVLIPSETQLAIIKGAVLYGHQPAEIGSRISRYSYGFRNTAHFDPRLHDQSRVHMVNGHAYCKNVFECIVMAGDAIKTGETLTISRYPGFAEQNLMSFPLFVTEGIPRLPIQYTDEPGMRQIGTIDVVLPGQGTQRRVDLCFTFGGTEIKVEAKDATSGYSASTTMDLLHS